MQAFEESPDLKKMIPELQDHPMFPLNQGAVDQTSGTLNSINPKTRFLKKHPIFGTKKNIAYFFYLVCRREGQY